MSKAALKEANNLRAAMALGSGPKISRAQGALLATVYAGTGWRLPGGGTSADSDAVVDAWLRAIVKSNPYDEYGNKTRVRTDAERRAFDREVASFSEAQERRREHVTSRAAAHPFGPKVTRNPRTSAKRRNPTVITPDEAQEFTNLPIMHTESQTDAEYAALGRITGSAYGRSEPTASDLALAAAWLDRYLARTPTARGRTLLKRLASRWRGSKKVNTAKRNPTTATSKPGKHGTLHLFSIEVLPLDPGQAPYTIRRWAYDLEAAARRAEEEIEDEGWGDRVGKVARVSAGKRNPYAVPIASGLIVNSGGKRRNPRPSTLADRWASPKIKPPRGYREMQGRGPYEYPRFIKGEIGALGTLLIVHEVRPTGIPGQRDQGGWRASEWTGRGWRDVGALAATPAAAAASVPRGRRKNGCACATKANPKKRAPRKKTKR